MDVSKIIGAIPLSAAAIYISREMFNTAKAKVKKWDKHVADDETTHAVMKTKMEAQEKWLENIDGKLDLLVGELIKK